MGQLIYFTGTIVTILDQLANRAQYYQFHTSPILCISISFDLVASGQTSPNPCVHLWKIGFYTPLIIIPSPSSVISLAFNEQGDYLACASQSFMCVYSRNGALVAKGESL